MNIKTFKLFCLKAGTKKADQIYEYYINLEEALNLLLTVGALRAHVALGQRIFLIMFSHTNSSYGALRSETYICQLSLSHSGVIIFSVSTQALWSLATLFVNTKPSSS